MSRLVDWVDRPTEFRDVTGDGIRDVVFTQRDRLTDGTELLVAQGNPDGTFERESRAWLFPSTSSAEPLLADIDGNTGSITLPGGPHVAVAAGHGASCAIEAAGGIRCFGQWTWEPLGTRFVSLAIDQANVCALRDDDRLECNAMTPP